MPRDVDKILEELRRKRQGSAPATPASTVKAVSEVREKAPSIDVDALLSSLSSSSKSTPAETSRKAEPTPASAEETERPRKAPKTADVSSPEEEAQAKKVFEAREPGEAREPEGITGKRSEDYIDDEFKRFFTQSVIITKSPEETNVDIKKKRRGLFRKKYVTDSLSLNINMIQEGSKAEKPVERPRPSRINSSSARTVSTSEMIAQNVRAIAGSEASSVNTDIRHAADKEAGEPTVKIARKATETSTRKEADTVRLPSKQSEPEPIVIPSQKRTRRSIDVDRLLSNTDDFDDMLRGILASRRGETVPPRTYEPDVRPVIESTSRAPQVDEDVRQEQHDRLAAFFVPSNDDADEVENEAEKDTVPEAVPEPEPYEQPAQIAPANSIIDNIYAAVLKDRENTSENRLPDETAYIRELDDGQTYEEQERTAAIPADAAPSEQQRLADTMEISSMAADEEYDEYMTNSEFLDRHDSESVDIFDELVDFKKTLSMRMIISLICGAVLTYMNLAVSAGAPVPGFMQPYSKPFMFYLAGTLIYALAFVVFFPTIVSGFRSLGNVPAQDSLISLGGILCLLQLALLTAFSRKVTPEDYTIFAAFACFIFAFNALGKSVATNTIIKNLTLTNVPDGINAGFIIDDGETVKTLARTLDEKVPKILTTRKTASISNVVKSGFSLHASDYTASGLAFVNYAVSAICIVLGFIGTKSPLGAISAGAAASCVMTPLSHTLINSLPSALMQKNLEKQGALVNGWQGIEQLARTTHVNFNARHLFPDGTVILHGIKTFEKERIDLAIIYAASVLIEKCDVLKPIFMNVIDGRTDILYPVESCEYFEKQGYVAWVENARVILGNRALMEKYDVSMPSETIESRYVREGRKPIYLAVGGRLFGMFVVSYSADESVKSSLHHLLDKGVSIILSTSDFNIDSAMVEKLYDVPKDCISVVNRKEAAMLSEFTSYTPQTEACMAHLDSLHSLVAGFFGAESARSAEKACSMIEIFAVVAAAVFSLVFTYSFTISNLPITSLLLIGVAIAGVTMVAAFFKRYTV
jgi:hypothetical protein